MVRAKKGESHTGKTVTAWDTAIADAQKKIEEARGRIDSLKRAIRGFRRLRDRGEPFPGEDACPTIIDAAQESGQGKVILGKARAVHTSLPLYIS